MIMAILGFVAPFIPDIMGMVQGQLDHKNELEMMRLRGQQAEAEHNYRVEEINIQADIAEMRAVRRPHKSYGVQLLDKAAETEGVMWKWMLNFAFGAFAVLDWLISFVRPGLTYWCFGLYSAVKIAHLSYFYELTGSLSKTLQTEWAFTTFDQEILTLMIAFWFGDRARRRAKQNG